MLCWEIKLFIVRFINGAQISYLGKISWIFYVEVRTVQIKMQTVHGVRLSVNYKNCQMCWSLWFANKGTQKNHVNEQQF